MSREKNSTYIIFELIKKLLGFLPDEAYLKLKYYYIFRKRLNITQPKTFNEKLQWLKLHDRKPIYTTMVDKYEAKRYVADIIGEEHIIPTIGVWDKFDDIDFDKLPDQFVMKCTHDSGGLVICKDKSKLDIKEAKRKIEKSLARDYYLAGREWPYKNVRRRIIAEQYMEDSKTAELRDYKFFCFGGQVRCYKIDFDRAKEHHANYFDADDNLLHVGETVCPPVFDKEIKQPETLEKMKILAQQLSKENPFLRADFYDVDGKIYFGELTFYPASGMGKFTPEEFDLEMGRWLVLPNRGGAVIITPEYIVYLTNRDSDLKDYKFYCFDGAPTYCQVISNRNTNEAIDFFDMDWNHQEFTGLALPSKPFSNSPIQAPSEFKKMKAIAAKLSNGIPFSRVDLYFINGHIYFGEITFYPASGFGEFKPDEWNIRIGNSVSLQKNGQRF